MITLKIDNRSLTQNTEFSFLVNNESSGVTAGTGVTVVNSDIFADSVTNDYALLGEWGAENSEILKLSSVTVSGGVHTIKFTASTKFAHSESTRITLLKYNQVRFYRTTTATFNSNPANALTGFVDIQPDDYFTKYYDLTNSTGFGWVVFYNATTTVVSSPTNAIPYASFSENSVQEIFKFFDSLLNTKEVSLISGQEKFKWLNEAYSRARNELNMVNQQYTVPVVETITTTASAAEYFLDTIANGGVLAQPFGRLIALTDSNGTQITKVDLRDEVAGDLLFARTHYYIRGAYLGFTPLPTSASTYSIYYMTRTAKLTSLYDNVDLPNNNYYFLVDHLMYRASQKLKKPASEMKEYKDNFEKGLADMKVTSVNQNIEGDSWRVDSSASV